jgi:hypothetical protein
MKTRGWRRELARSATIPSGYGIGWTDASQGIVVCYPWPANRLARLWHETAWRIGRAMRALRGPSREQDEFLSAHRLHRERQVLSEQYAAGYIAGWHECFDACLEAVEEELGRAGIVQGSSFGERVSQRALPAEKRSKPN